MSERYEALVIGTGFGGSINACRLAKRWPDGKVLVLERGKRYPLGSFPRTPHDFARNFWNLPGEGRDRPGPMTGDSQRGMFDVRNYGHMDVVMSAGLGGGSLIYANVFLEPPDAVFDSRWPATAHKAELMPYYHVAKEVLGSRPIPVNDDPRRHIPRTQAFGEIAEKLGRESKLVDINVFFGNDFEKPLDPGVQDHNRYGVLQTSCRYCGECDVGCNYQSKNTLDLNYLHVAENRYGAEILTEHIAEKIVPVDENGDPDPDADGSHGFEVHYCDLANGNNSVKALTNRVVVSAGTLGSTELLMRCRDVYGTLPRISQHLGQQFSGNGDFLSFVVGLDEPIDPNYGPVITQKTDFNLFSDFEGDRAFILEDAGYPTFLAWFTEGVKPGYLRFPALWRTFRHVIGRWFKGRSSGRIGYALTDILRGDISYHTAVLLCMGVDRSNGIMSLDKNDNLTIDWPWKDSIELYRAILRAGKEFKKAGGGDTFIPLPTWWLPFRKNITVHALGGCVIGDDPDRGVTSADRADFGRVFGYQGLHVADGALLPTAVGANPTATISALSEMVAEAITGIAPDAHL